MGDRFTSRKGGLIDSCSREFLKSIDFAVKEKQLITQMYPYRPLSRRLDRCDRMIQNEGNDSRKLFTLKIALCR